MVPPEVIDIMERLRREREERDRPALELPLYPQDDPFLERKIDDDEITVKDVIVIDMA